MPPSNKNRSGLGDTGDVAGGSFTGKKAKNTPSLADDLICPITQELPIDPVNAEDGQHYEREAIETHIKTTPGRKLKSPITNEGMGPRLLPAHRIKSAIETAVSLGHITGDLADRWNEKMEQKKKMEKLVKKAEAGKKNSMYKLGMCYMNGKNGFQEDAQLAYKWLKRADEKGDNNATTSLGWLLVQSSGLPENQIAGATYLGIAAGRGSNSAAAKLGFLFADGMAGVSVNTEKAIYWLEQSLTLSGPLRDEAKDLVRQELQLLQQLQLLRAKIADIHDKSVAS